MSTSPAHQALDVGYQRRGEREADVSGTVHADGGEEMGLLIGIDFGHTAVAAVGSPGAEGGVGRAVA